MNRERKGAVKKRLLVAILSVFLLLSSCTEAVPITEAKTEDRKTLAERPLSPKVENPLTWEKIGEIPIAREGMTPMELRKICTDFMRLQLTFEWTPKTNLEYVLGVREKPMVFYHGRVYGGLPYRSFNANGNLYTFMEFYDPETGVLDGGNYRGNDLAGVIGNDCASSPFWAWNRVINSNRNFKDFTAESGFTNTGLVPENNLLPVGGYTTTSSGTWDDKAGTRAVCQNNGEQKMYEAYACLLPADGILHFYPASGGVLPSVNHLMMCSSEATVVRNEDGSIDGEKSFVTILDQESNLTTVRRESTSVHYQGGVDHVFTFAELFRQSYVPFTFAEFLGLDPIEEGEARLLCDGDPTKFEELKAASVTANYAISHVKILFFEESGDLRHSYVLRPTLLNTRTQSLEKLLIPSIGFYADSESACRIEVQLGNGQRIFVFEGVLTK